MKPWEPGETVTSYIGRLEAEVNRLRAERLMLDRRIHNQRVALRENWQTIEMRASWKRAWYPSKLLTALLNRNRTAADQ